MKNFLLDISLQFLVACLACFLVLTLVKPENGTNIVAVDLEGYISKLQKEWEEGKLNEEDLRKDLSEIKDIIKMIPQICPNTVVIQKKMLLAGNTFQISAEALMVLKDFSPEKRRLFLESICYK